MNCKVLYSIAILAVILVLVSVCGCSQSTGSNDKGAVSNNTSAGNNGTSAGIANKTDMDVANDTAEIILQSLNNGNYADFIYNLNSSLVPLIDESNFTTLRTAMILKYGKYVSKSGPQSSVVSGYNVYLYNCTFEKNKIRLALGMNMTNRSQVEGVRFV